MHTLDLANFPVTDTLKMLASLLEKITNANDQLKTHNNSNSNNETISNQQQAVTPFTRFHARSVPSIDIHSYLSRILKYCPTSNECFLSLLVYFDRMSKNAMKTTGKPFSIDSFNIHRLIIAGGLPVSELNHLELEFLVLNDFRLAITVEELQRYGDQLLKHWVMEEEINKGVPSTDETSSSSKGGGSKSLKEEDSIYHHLNNNSNGSNNHFGRGHRRESSHPAKPISNTTYQTTLTSSPQIYSSSYSSKTPPQPPSSILTNSPSSPSSMLSNTSINGNSSNSSNNSSQQIPINGSPMHAPFISNNVFNTQPHFHHLHKQYAHHSQSQHVRSMSLGSTVKRANSSGSLLSRARSGDLTDELQQYHQQRHSSPKPIINPDDLAYRTAAGAPPFVPPPPSLQSKQSSSMNASSYQYATPSSSSYPFSGYPPPPSTQSLTGGFSINPATAIGNVAHSAAVAALSYARRASLALPPLPRHIAAFHTSSLPSPITTTNPTTNTNGNNNNGTITNTTTAKKKNNNNDILNPNTTRRCSVPAWSGSTLSKATNSVMVNGYNGSASIPVAPEIPRRGSWVIVNNPTNQATHYHHGHYSHGGHHDLHHHHRSTTGEIITTTTSTTTNNNKSTSPSSPPSPPLPSSPSSLPSFHTTTAKSTPSTITVITTKVDSNISDNNDNKLSNINGITSITNKSDTENQSKKN
ncbi:6745_t:CDS:2 [Entrophospora sp. SA101]|nr:6745_t:CDS:2 [Entrophospora sp. SA101]CAJ0868103.1 18771_t:CDS:2 [Entrophospora sp. SA101]